MQQIGPDHFRSIDGSDPHKRTWIHDGKADEPDLMPSPHPLPRQYEDAQRVPLPADPHAGGFTLHLTLKDWMFVQRALMEARIKDPTVNDTFIRLREQIDPGAAVK
jgi:hypothetical protein